MDVLRSCVVGKKQQRKEQGQRDHVSHNDNQFLAVYVSVHCM